MNAIIDHLKVEDEGELPKDDPQVRRFPIDPPASSQTASFEDSSKDPDLNTPRKKKVKIDPSPRPRPPPGSGKRKAPDMQGNGLGEEKKSLVEIETEDVEDLDWKKAVPTGKKTTVDEDE